MLTVDQYHRMIDAGILIEGEPIELLEGYLVNKMPQNPSHATVNSRLIARFSRRLPPDWFVRSQLPVTLSDSEPEPDAAVVRGDDTVYNLRHPFPADFGIIIEVSDSTLVFDRREKGRIYARAGIPVYWIVNVVGRQIEVYTDPDASANPPAYRSRVDYLPGQDVPLVLDGVAVGTVPAGEIIP
jgi:Uma2 family endonuclease